MSNEIKLKIPQADLQILKNEIITAIQKLPNHGALKFNSKLILDVCNTIEACKVVRKSKRKLNKKEIVIDVLNAVFELDPASKVVIGDIIDDLHDNKKIKLESTMKFLGKGAWNWIKKRVL
jgi:histidinol phosphatase-like enzyme